ncbi:glycosyltransferase [Burkholderia anthina]|uniref:glycosyltransferase n=1 Tax=Burkholderia anthina TaxID=179879 RepID=UPI000F5F89DA|nr:glycosyltransferase [Burkholderia anthina]RQX84308.1 glycosyltransferase [Burkholderia anthina]
MVIEAALRKSLLAIPSINGGKLLERMLPTLRIPSELVVVLDQGSTDNTEEVCRRAGVVLRQLGRPHTYTEACNIGAEMAAERGCDFVFVANNDITFTTDVVRELLAELLEDPNLGIVAPAQMLVDEKASVRQLAYRVYWDLETLTFAHDFTPPRGNTYRLEADFCELTFAGIRMSTIEKIGFLDNDYGFYHEDADFGFRLRDAGYTCAYLPNSQIEHWTSSTFASRPSQMKLDYLAKNKHRFAEKFLGQYVAHKDHKSSDTTSWNIVNKNLHPYLRRNGLVHRDAPELIFTHPGTKPFDYLYTVWETTRLPDAWLPFKDDYKMVLTPSTWGVEVLKQAGFGRVHYVPLGVESDVFQPWGPSDRLADGKTFLWFSRNQHRKGLDVMLRAWRPFHRAHPEAKLILMGVGLLDAMPTPDTARMWKHFRIAEYLADGISVYETISGMDEDFLAMLYRSVDFTVCSSRAEGFGFGIAESMACGTPAIFGDFSSMSDFAIPGALLFDGVEARADYSDKGFGDVGNWWEPSVEHLTSLLFEANAMGPERYRMLSKSGVRAIRTKFSWRESSFAIRRALIAESEGKRSMPAGLSGALQRADNARAGREPQSQFATSRANHSGAAIRWNGMAARGIRRIGFLSTFFADQLELHGWKYAFSACYRQLLKPFVRSRGQWLVQRVSGGRSVRTVPAGDAIVSDEVRQGVLFIGYAEGALGLGQAFRANLKAAEAANVPFAVYPFRAGIETRLIGPYMEDRYDVNHRYDVNVIEVACDQVPVVFGNLNPRLLTGSYNILCPYWELPKAPQAWREHLTNIHEIWAPNQFIADAFAHIFDGPIVVMPPAMEDTGGDHPGRSHFGMDEGRLYFMFSFDYYSSPYRKNPLGVLQAFQQAFPRGDENVGLVIKSTGAPDHYPDIKETIRDAMKRDSRILMFDKNFARDEMLGLIRASDVYVSLHRAEGFGLGMAEAMTFGRIVIGTDYSGSTDFLSDETGYPVAYQLRELEAHEYPWSQGQVWAEPDLNAAIDAMRRVAENPEEGQRRGEAAVEFVSRRYRPEAVGKVMKERLDVLFATGSPVKGE